MKRVLCVGGEVCEELSKEDTTGLLVEIFYVQTGREALEKLVEHYDLILIHLGTEIPAWEILKQARQITSHVVFLGDIPLSEERIQALKREGLYEYIVEPLSAESLFERILELLELHS